MNRHAERRRPAIRRVMRAIREFAATPLLVIGAFCVLAAISILADQEHVAGLDAARRSVGTFIGKDAASSTLQAIAGGLVTVTSITFSVLLLAVQQTASSLSPVVFDQWVRRKSNQVFLGFFVGLAIFAYVVMAAVGDKTPPILGAAIATGMTVVAMFFLLVLVYTTVDQMRPESVMRLIHDRALDARRRESQLVQRTRRSAESDDPVHASFRAKTSGYVNGIDLDILARALAEAPRAEIALRVTLGDYVASGDCVASVRDDDPERARSLADTVRSAVMIAPRRDLDRDATTGIDQLANIAWTNGSSSRQNPEIAREALDVLKDIASQWIVDDPAQRQRSDGPPLPIVYPDNDVDRILDVLFSLLVVAHESKQHTLAARVLGVYADLADRAGDEVKQRLEQDIEAAADVVAETPHSPVLARAVDRVRSSFD